jgi:hypothetical protein
LKKAYIGNSLWGKSRGSLCSLAFEESLYW